jgi:hypothetical protein
MKYLIVVLLLLVSCSTEQRVHRMAKHNHNPTYKGSYAKWYHIK